MFLEKFGYYDIVFHRPKCPITLDFYLVLYYNSHTDTSMVSEIHKEEK